MKYKYFLTALLVLPPILILFPKVKCIIVGHRPSHLRFVNEDRQLSHCVICHSVIAAPLDAEQKDVQIAAQAQHIARWN